MPETKIHIVEVDVPTTVDAEDPAFCAFCETCSWKGEWQHTDQFGDPHSQEAWDAAFDAAEAEGKDHVEEVSK